MAAYTLEEVTSRRATREFLDLPKRLYRDEPHWICPLDQDIENRFHPETNELPVSYTHLTLPTIA